MSRQEHGKRQPPESTSSQRQSGPLLGSGQRNYPPLFLYSMGFAEPGKEVNSKGGNDPETITICEKPSRYLFYFQNYSDLCPRKPNPLPDGNLFPDAWASATHRHLHVSRRQTCPDGFKLPERGNSRRVLRSLAGSTDHLTCFVIAELLLAPSLERWHA